MIGSIPSYGYLPEAAPAAPEVTAGKVLTSAEEKKLYQACVDFESIFVKQMLDSMRSTVPKGGLFDGGMSREIFEDRLYDSYAEKISATAGLGLAKQMFEQIKETL